MKRLRNTVLGLIFLACSSISCAQSILGTHNLALQWVSWDYFGKVNAITQNGLTSLSGRQNSRTSTDYVHIDGYVSEMTSAGFKFKGKITTQVTFINSGKPCERNGTFIFKAPPNKKYWRLQEMDNPCDGVTDYVDIFF